MSTTSLGGTTPPGLFDDQPEAIIFDPNDAITNVTQQLKPFNSIVHIIKNEQQFDMFLQDKPRQTVVSILIFPNETRDYIITFINNHIRQQQSVHSFYLFFTNGQQHAIELRNHFTRLLECYSITNHLHSEIRDILSTVCDLNAKFCYRREKEEEEAKGNNSLAFIYEQQRRERLRLQIIINTNLILEIDKDHL